MNKFTLFAVLTVSGNCLYAQQDPQYTQFMHNKQLYNPAITGFYGEHCATLLARTQYTSYRDQTYYLNDDANNNLALYGSKGAQTLTFSYGAPIPINKQSSGLNSGGIGLSVYSDKVGYLSTNYLKLDIAFRRKLKSSFIGFGTNVGAMQKEIDLNGLIYKDPLDPKIPQTVNSSNVNINTGIGLWFYAPKYHELTVGYAIQNLIGNPFNFAGISALAQGLHQYLNIGAEFKVMTVNVNPYLQIKTGQQTTIFNSSVAQTGTISVFNPDATAGIVVDVMPRFQVGGGIRASTQNIESVNAMMCFYATPNLRMGYAYDINTSRLNANNNNTHEVMLKYCFMKDKTKGLGDPRHLDRIKVYDKLKGEL